ncbi:MAG: TonB-dependent receptor [Gemmatimonadota bacterium]|nr:TonB-dependent receptor [Gemmatimonadota bacterium]
MSRAKSSNSGTVGPLMLIILVAAVALFHPSDVRAAPAPVPQASDTVPLAPIEVSVLRTPLLQNASPFSVSVLAGDDLQRGRSGFFLQEALQGLPGVQVQNRFNPAVGERVAIRGFGARAQFGLRGIRVIVDGIPATLPDGQSSLDHLDIGSLARVEALRGPASALFGNASGGVLSFTTRDPAAVPFDVDVMGVTGSDGLWRGQLTASGTVENTGYLVTVSGQRWDGYRTIDPSSARVDTLGATYGGSERLGFNARVTTPVAGGQLSLTANALDLDAENAGSKSDDFAPDAYRQINDLYLRFRTGKTLQQQQAGLRWEGPLGGALQADLSAYGVHRTINNPIPFDEIDLARKGGGIRAQLGSTVAAGSSELHWQGGFQYDLQNDDRSEISKGFGTGQPAAGATPFLDQAEDVRSASVFLQGTLELPGGAIALAGLRYDNHEFTADDRVPVTTQNADDSGSRTMDAVSPSIGISVPAGQSANFFASVGTVFETPTTSELSNQPNAAGGFNPNLDPMSGESFEVGVRGDLGSVAAFELTGYQTNLRNELIRFELEGFDDVSYFRNSGESRHRGVEATLVAASSDGVVRASATYTHTDAEFREYELGGDDLSGNRVPGVSPNRVQGLFRLSPSQWFAEITGTYVDEVPVNDRNATTTPSYFLVDIRAGLDEFAMGTMNISPWVALTNALNKDYIASVAVNAFGSRFFEPGPDLSFQLGFRASWGGQ